LTADLIKSHKLIFKILKLLKMKKTLLNFFSEEILSRSEQRRVTGGTCYAESSSGSLQSGDKAYIKSFAKQNGTNWCCDSCQSATWMQKWYGSKGGK
jgi:hypothetical protein